jgi:hypothetical protein
MCGREPVFFRCLTLELSGPERQDALGRQQTIYMPWLLPAQGGLPRRVRSRATG